MATWCLEGKDKDPKIKLLYNESNGMSLTPFFFKTFRHVKQTLIVGDGFRIVDLKSHAFDLYCLPAALLFKTKRFLFIDVYGQG